MIWSSSRMCIRSLLLFKVIEVIFCFIWFLRIWIVFEWNLVVFVIHILNYYFWSWHRAINSWLSILVHWQDSSSSRFHLLILKICFINHFLYLHAWWSQICTVFFQKCNLISNIVLQSILIEIQNQLIILRRYWLIIFFILILWSFFSRILFL